MLLLASSCLLLTHLMFLTIPDCSLLFLNILFSLSPTEHLGSSVGLKTPDAISVPQSFQDVPLCSSSFSEPPRGLFQSHTFRNLPDSCPCFYHGVLTIKQGKKLFQSPFLSQNQNRTSPQDSCHTELCDSTSTQPNNHPTLANNKTTYQLPCPPKGDPRGDPRGDPNRCVCITMCEGT